MTIKQIVLLVGILILSVGTLFSQTDKAKQTFEEFDKRRSAITYETATLQMRIVDPRGRAREREMQTWSHQNGDDSKSLVRFLAPADVRGTGFLTIRDGGNEVQRLFLPALNRIQTIASGQRGDRFMGSDFTYEDMGDQDPDDFTFSTVNENTSSGTMLIKADRKESTTYAYAHFLIDTKRYILLEAEYYSESGELIRRLEAADLVEIRDGIWRANKLTMRDVKANRFTELIWKSRTLDEPISPVTFTERELRSQ
jgi:hypothetical protein